ncbi:hypothetical protein B2J93_4213 [Marssonina coronariae]|uniref:ABC transporter domain-containing protein n=1 Tax=Diplocarpon coronariae TaxID=2795749 RepID=A0A218ZA02_9HELO|nr:hypothetical protein B2J93_4213 [Marssonina coronariae]
MRRELANVSKTRSEGSTSTGHQSYGLKRVTTAGTHRSRQGENEEDYEEREGFELGEFLTDGHFEKRQEGRSAKKVGMVYTNLTVQGVGATATFFKTLPSAVVGPGAAGKKRDLIHDFTEFVRDGEILLVLGRPGSGCSTFLKAVSNKREAFAGVNGDVTYGGIPASVQIKKYKGEVNYTEEDDKYFPTLTVEQTRNSSLLSISGGERKRVPIAEILATKSTVVAWDNSTRGLDASTALDYAKSLRVMTDTSNRTTLVTLYQAAEGIYELIDMVLVINEGKMAYQGPAKAAKQKVKAASALSDAEQGDKGLSPTSASGSSEILDGERQEEALQEIFESNSVFIMEIVQYPVPYMCGKRKLLNKVNGYAKPGVMIALVGSSGAGKTTLLNTLSQRQNTGVVSGDMLVDGRPLGSEFQRGTGLCEQLDLQDGTATIREALVFFAILRQDRSIPGAEKIAFLKKLSYAGQAIVCTIHQPSSVLIHQFDMIMALNPGGKTIYFGPVGDGGKDVIKYFAERGVQCPTHKNVAEFILETAAKGGKRGDGKKLDWNEE